MEVAGRIKVKNVDIQVSANFKKSELVVTTNEQYPQDIKIEFHQDKCDLVDPYKIGESFEVFWFEKGALGMVEKIIAFVPTVFFGTFFEHRNQVFVFSFSVFDKGTINHDVAKVTFGIEGDNGVFIQLVWRGRIVHSGLHIILHFYNITFESVWIGVLGVFQVKLASG